MLTMQRLNKVGEWIKRNGRPLEAARFEYHFQGGSREKVLHCLSEFQNDDGGFAHGLELDNWNPNSTPLVSSIALKILYETGFRESNEMIDKCINYLVHNHFNKQTGTWATIIPSNNEYPHAPWWTWEENGRNTWDFNPSIEIAGFIAFYSEADTLPNQIANLCFKKAEQYLFSDNQISEHFHEVYCYLHSLILAKQASHKVSVNIKSMEDKIGEYVEAAICRDPAEWFVSYVAQPIDFMNQLNVDDLSIIKKYKDEMLKNAQILIDKLPENDVWDITWSWNGNYPEVFDKAKTIWKAVLAVNRLVKFKRLGILNFTDKGNYSIS